MIGEGDLEQVSGDGSLSGALRTRMEAGEGLSLVGVNGDGIVQMSDFEHFADASHGVQDDQTAAAACESNVALYERTNSRAIDLSCVR